MSKNEVLFPSAEPPVSLTKGAKGGPTNECEKIYGKMRRSIVEVFPDDSGAWDWKSERGAHLRIEPPPATAAQWVEQQLPHAHAFARTMIERQFAFWNTSEKRGFEANDKTLRPLQRALLAWYSIAGLTGGTRQKLPAVLIRAPYGAGKTLVAGHIVEAFQDELMWQMHEGVDRKEIPRLAVIGRRQDILVQNAMGDRYRALRPPYTVSEQHVREFHRQLTQRYGEAFTKLFPQPHGKQSPWAQLFAEQEEEQDTETRLRRFFDAHKAQMPKSKKSGEAREIVEVVGALMRGEITLLPDHHNVPHVHQAPERLIDLEAKGFRGDLAYALRSDVGIIASHRHLLPDPSLYTNRHEPGRPDRLIGITQGTALMRPHANVRGDFANEILPNEDHELLEVLDEAHKDSPVAMGAAAKQSSGNAPAIVALTGQDMGVEGFVRSPSSNAAESVKMLITKPVAFTFIGNQKQPYSQGSEGAWEQYKQTMFEPIPILTALKLPQPWEVDGLTVVPPALVWEYGHRIAEAYAKEGILVEVHCYDGKLGMDRWKVLEDTLRTPRQKGQPPRRIVTAPQQIATGLHLTIENIDVLCRVHSFELDQLLGRLYHQSNLGAPPNSRTSFRQQVFSETMAVQLRRTAAELGYPLSPTGAVWPALQCGIDVQAKERDEKRGAKKFGKPVPVPDERKPVVSWKPKPSLLKPMEITSPYLLKLLVEKAARDQSKRLQATAALANGTPESQHAQVVTVSKKHGDGMLVLRLPVTERGMVTANAIATVARAHDLVEYTGSLADRANKAYGEDKRGEKLANAVLERIIELKQTKQRRASMFANANS